MADAPGLGSGTARCGGSSPLPRTHRPPLAAPTLARAALRGPQPNSAPAANLGSWMLSRAPTTADGRRRTPTRMRSSSPLPRTHRPPLAAPTLARAALRGPQPNSARAAGLRTWAPALRVDALSEPTDSGVSYPTLRTRPLPRRIRASWGSPCGRRVGDSSRAVPCAGQDQKVPLETQGLKACPTRNTD